MTPEQIELVSKELDTILDRFDLLLQITPDKWLKCEELYNRLTKLDTIFGTIARMGKNMKLISNFLNQLQKDFPDVTEVVALHERCQKYLYGLNNTGTSIIGDRNEKPGI